MTVSTGDTRRDVAPVDDEIRVDADASPSFTERLGFPDDLRFWRESGLVVAVVAPLVAVIYRLWDFPWHVPFVYDGDGLTTAAYTKALIERGWYFTNPRLAAPFVADWRDFPVGGENLHWLALKILGVATGDYGIAVNAYFFLSFFAIALTTYFVARYLRLGRPAALVVGVLYAFLPYHAYRNVGHLARGVYYVLPLVVLVLLWACDHRNELMTTNDAGRRRWRRGRVGFALGVGVVLGASDTQNAAFMISILAVVTVVAAIGERDWRPLLGFVVLSAVTMASLTLNNAPYFLGRAERGRNEVVAQRSIKDQDGFALRPVNLLLPAPGHRIGALADLSKESADAQATNSESGGTSLGIVGAVGLLASLGALLAMALAARRRDGLRRRLARLGMLNAIAILIGTIGGFAFLLALAGFLQYRSWNRISLFIGLFSLLASGMLLEQGFAWLRGRGLRAGVTTAIVVGTTALLVVGGAFDQITPSYVPDYSLTALRFGQDADFYHRLERRLPRDSMVFMLPVSTFPEPGRIVDMGDYAQLAGYLHTDHLRFSYAGMKGRPEGDWTANLAACDPRTEITQIAAVGFDTAVLDTRGYQDGGVAYLEAVRPLVGAPRERSADGHLLALDLAPLRARMRADVGGTTVRAWRDSVAGTTLEWPGFAAQEVACPATRRWAEQRDPSVTVTNSTDGALRVRVAGAVVADPRATRLRTTGAGPDRAVPLTDGRGRIDETLTVPPGTSAIGLRVDGPPVQRGTGGDADRWFALEDTTVRPLGAPSIDAWAHSPAAESDAG